MTGWQATNLGTTDMAISRTDRAARIEFRRPERLNAITLDSGRALLGALSELADDDTVRAVMITGRGRAFSTGADVTDTFADLDSRSRVTDDLRTVTAPAILAIRQMSKPVVAAVNGPAAGLGCAIALACDQVIVAQSAYFLLAYANVGLTLDGGASAFVTARVGMGRALRMALLAERVPADVAVQWGLADESVPDDEFDEAAEALTMRLADGPTASYAATKALINQAQFPALAEQLEFETTLQAELLSRPEFDDAVKSFTRRGGER